MVYDLAPPLAALVPSQLVSNVAVINVPSIVIRIFMVFTGSWDGCGAGVAGSASPV
jgi:hypothetical protein